MQVNKISPTINKVYTFNSTSFKDTPQNIEDKNDFIKKNKHFLIPATLVLLTIFGIGIKKSFFSDKVTDLSDELKTEATDYVKNLSKSMSLALGKEVKAEDLSSVISGEELLKELKALKKENFVASTENLEKGIFQADLHSHSLYSDGLGNVEDILEQVAGYADSLKLKTGKNFIFALTDHDSCEGSKEALKIISENSKKFENVRFVVGSELSYLIKSDKTSNPYETSEILVYGFNPFDEKIGKYFENLYKKRKTMVIDYLSELKQMFDYADFSIEEFNQFYGKNYMMNYQWKVHNYAQTKNAVSGLAISQNIDKAEMYKEIMSKTERWKKTLYDLRQSSLVPQSYGEDSRIMDMCRNKYSPKKIGDRIDYKTEVNFADIVETFGGDKNIFGAFAHPYYVTERNSQAESLLKDLVLQSKGFVKATESHHQAYRPNIKTETIEKFNADLVFDNKLLELGGRDNHEVDWLKFL